MEEANGFHCAISLQVQWTIPTFGEFKMRFVFTRCLMLLLLGVFLLAHGQVVFAQSTPPNGGDFSNNPDPKKLPTGVILVKGAWASATDSSTPLPENGSVTNNVYNNAYFGMTYPLAADWTEKYKGPPPSDSGYYVLGQFVPAGTSKGASLGSVLVTAQDLFFTLTPAMSALELVNYSMFNLGGDYKVERLPGEVTIGNSSFVRFDYASPAAELHWHILTTQIRCHAVQFVFTSRDTSLIDGLIQQVSKMKLLANATSGPGADAPVCIKDYARDENIVERVDPVLTERRYNPIPVRIIIDKEGKVKHIHFLSAFPEQSTAISEALWQWRFKPYVRNGKPQEVETGILFGRAPRIAKTQASTVTTE